MTASRHQPTEEQAREWIATRQDHHDRADWAVVRRHDDRVMGEVVFNQLDTDNASVNFRILLISREYFNQGYGTEAAKLAVDYGFNIGLHRIELGVYDFNGRGQRAYEKAGFVREGVLRDALYWDGQWHDSIIMSILATDR